MNLFNRLFMILLLLGLLALSLATAIVPELVLTSARQGVDGALAWVRAWEAGNPLFFRVIQVGFAVVGVAIFGSLLLLELRRSRRKSVRVRTEWGGQAEVTVESVARRLVYHVDQLSDVIQVRPDVRARGRNVDVSLRLETMPDIDVPMKTEEVMAVAREVIEEQMGLQLGRLEVHIEHSPYPEELAPATR